MSKSYWRTTSRWRRRQGVKRPTWGQILRQLGTGTLVVALWGIAFAIFVNVIPDSGPADTPGGSATMQTPEVVSDAPAAASVTPTLTTTSEPTPTQLATIPSPSSTAPAATPDGVQITAETPAAASHTPSTEETLTPSSPAIPPTSSPTPPTTTPTMIAAEEAQVSFNVDVLPILQNRCAKCHGGERTEEGLDLTTYAGLVAGSWNGSVIEPGSAENSYLLELILSGEMPKRAPRLLPAEIRFIADWINAGAPDN